MLLTLEGLDGSGKTTVWKTLRDGDALPEGAVFTHEPTDTWYGEAVTRSLRTDDADPLAECFLYTADHAAHLANTVEPALAADRVVVSDRYVDSRYAYQGASLADRFDDALAFVRDLHRPWTREPDATVYLDLDPETAAERSAAANKFETAEHLADVREGYERLIADEPDRFHRVDASQPTEDVLAAVERVVTDLRT